MTGVGRFNPFILALLFIMIFRCGMAAVHSAMVPVDAIDMALHVLVVCVLMHVGEFGSRARTGWVWG